MKALVLTENDIQLQDFPTPTPQAGEVLVKVKTAALNRRDQWAREGLYPGMTYNCVLGSDACGVVTQVGEGVEEAWLAQEVIINPNRHWGDDQAYQSKDYNILGMPSNGTFAEYVVVPSDRLHKKPAYLTDEEAAAVPLAALTAYRVVFTKGNLQAGQQLLVTGIGGGVAQFVAQFGMAAGAQVFATSGDNEKLDKMKELGLTGGVNYREENWHKALLKQSGGFDLIIDSAGGKGFNLLLKTMKPAATLVFYGATLGGPQLDMPRIFFGQYTIKGSTMGSDEEFAQMLSFIAQHQVKPIVDSVRPFDEIIEAFNDMRDGKLFGKVVVQL